MFDKDSFADIKDKMACMAAQKYFQANVSTYKIELENAGASYEQIEKIVNGLWRRLLAAAKRYKAPLSNAAKVAQARME